MRQKLLLTLALLGILVIAYTPAFAQAPDGEEVEVEFFIADEMGPDFDWVAADGGMIFAGMGQGRGPGMEKGIRGRVCELMGMADDLELTKEQRKQIEDLNFGHRKALIPQRAQLQVMNLELRKLIRNDARESEINAQIDQIGKLRTDIQKQSMKHRLAVKAVLTPEQREKLNDRPYRMGQGKGAEMKDAIIKKLEKRQGRGRGL